MKSPIHGRPVLVGLLSAALAVSASTLAGPALAVPAAPTGASAAEPGGSPSAKDVSGRDALGQHDRELLAEALSKGTKRVTLIVATTEGETDSVVSGLEDLGGSVMSRYDQVGYVSVNLPTKAVTKAADLSDVEGVDLDEVVENPSPSATTRSGAAAVAQEGPGPDTPDSNPYMPTRDTGAIAFKQRYPNSDGRGITIGILDSGVDLDHPALAETTTGERKIVDWVTATSPLEDPSWRFMSTEVTGPTFTYQAQTWTAPAGTYRINRFNEAIAVGEAGGDVNRDGDTSDLFGVLYDPATHDIWVDTDQDNDFTDEGDAMRPYNEDFGVNHFGTDNPATEIAERMPFVVEYREDVDSTPIGGPGPLDVVNIGIPQAAHGSHVAGITAANSMFGGEMDGAAPGAKLISSRACNWGGGCTAVALTDGMSDLVLNRGVDVVNMSIGGLPALNDGNNARAELYNRLIDESGVQIFLSAGNSGPGINTIGDPSVSSDAVSVASSITKETWLSNYGSTVSSAENLHNYSSRGPREDGGFKPDLMAPGSAISTIPTWQPGTAVAEAGYQLPPGYAHFNGTSMASPQAAGAAALLLSRARQTDVAVMPTQLRASMFSTANFRAGIPAAGQGRGQVDLLEAWTVLSQEPTIRSYTSRAQVCTPLDDFLATPNRGTGLYNRCAPGAGGGQSPGQARVYPIDITRTSGPSRAVAHRVSIVGNDGTYTAPTTVNLPLNQAVRIKVKATPRTAGLHSAILRVDDPRTTTIEHDVAMNIVATSAPTAPGFSATQTSSVERNLTKSLFIPVPEGASSLQLNLGGIASGSQTRFIAIDPYGVPVESTSSLVCFTNFSDREACNPNARAYEDPLPGVWEIEVEARRTSPSLRNPYRLTAAVQGITVDPETVTLPSVEAGTPEPVEWEVTNNYGPVTVHGEGGPLGSSFSERPTIADGAVQDFEVEVPEGSSRLDVAIGNVSDLAADLDLEVYLGDDLVASDADGDSEESVSIPNPEAGTYTVEVIGYEVPAGTTEYDYLDVFYSPALGQLAVDPTETTLARGQSATIAGEVTANDTPAEGRQLFGELVVLSEQDAVLGTGSVVIEEVTEPTPPAGG